MPIYTRGGDDGTTGLIGGQRISKASHRVACTGSVDELNAVIGWAAVAATGVSADLRQVQADLFVLGAYVAAPGVDAESAVLPPLEPALVERLERQIDAAEACLEPLRQFILPGGSEGAARLHVARTVCRRAERELAALAAAEPLPTVVLVYLNRLSDWLFVQARVANQQAGQPDVPWTR